MCATTHVHVCICVWSPEQNLKYGYLDNIHLVFDYSPLFTQNSAGVPRMTGQGAPEIHRLLRFQVCTTMPSLYVDSERAKSGHAC